VCGRGEVFYVRSDCQRTGGRKLVGKFIHLRPLCRRRRREDQKPSSIFGELEKGRKKGIDLQYFSRKLQYGSRAN